MAWFGDGLPSLSNLKGQITSFTKEVLSEGIVEEIDERSKALNEANERCVQLQELLNSKDAEISLLRRQNCDLQKVVIEFNAKQKDSNDVDQDEANEGFFWDPPTAKTRNSKTQNQTRQLQEQLAQATVKIRELETELKRAQKINHPSLKDEIPDGHQKAEFLRAKQDMVNRIIQMEEKTREAERNSKRMQVDETALINDFRTVIAKLNSLEKLDLVRGALKALETENTKSGETNKQEKSDFDEKSKFVAQESMSNRDSELHKKVEELQEENKRLFTSIEELDQQHGESIDKLLSLKEEIEKKHECLQNAYEQLYVDYNQAQNKVTQLESKLVFPETSKDIDNTVACQSVQTISLEKEHKVAQTEFQKTNDNSPEETADELTRKIKNILKNSCIDTDPGESIFEAVAKQYVDANWKKDVLERKVTEMTRDLKETVEMKETLQEECNDMQAHIDTLLLEIQDLKLNLPSIPEASEERVASLETETESLHEEIKRLQAENEVMRNEHSNLRNHVENNQMPMQSMENSSTEVVNGKQLDSAEGVDHSSRNTEDIKNTIEDLNQRLIASLNDNNELRKKIESLEICESQMQDQLRMSLEKCKGLDENIEFIEELKLELENVRREYKTVISNVKRLESDLMLVEETKNELEKENEHLFQKKEELEAELSKWRDICLEKENNNVVEDLQEQLNKATQEKNDLEYDILCMRKELDTALNDVDLKENQMAKLNQAHENLAKEKNSLAEQLNAVQEESNDKIELLNTEKSLLEQEHAELKHETEIYVEELKKLKQRLQEKEDICAALEKELSDVRLETSTLKSENDTLKISLRELDELKNEVEHKNLTIEELRTITLEYEQIKDEIERLRRREQELLVVKKRFILFFDENPIMGMSDDIIELLEECMTSKPEKEDLPNFMNDDDDSEEEYYFLRKSNNNLMKEVTETKNKLQKAIDTNKESTDMAKETIESLSHLIREKDEEINILKASIESTVNNVTETSDALNTLKNERDELVKLVTIKHNESLQYHGEIQRLTQILNEQTARLQTLTTEQEINVSSLSQKEAELLWTRNELQVLQQRLKNIEDSDNSKETCSIVEHSTQAAEIAILNEKCNALEAALIQEQSNTRMLQNQFTESQNKETIAAKELERLRTHLVEMESSYTEEALIAEETRKELEVKLVQAEERMKNSSTVYTSASIRANQQVETLQQQIALIIQQRDDIQSKLSAAEDKVLSQTASLSNLQIVLEQFQRDKEKDILSATERIHARLNDSYKKQEELSNEVANLKDQLAEAKECLQAASRLSEQLDKKTERIEQLSQEVERLTELVNTADRRIEEAKLSGEGKVDKTLIKNLFLGYLSSSAGDKSSVLRVFSTILDFNDSERDKVGLNTPTAQNSWFSRLNGGSPSSNKEQEASLSAAFVRFLESESKPKPQLPALPIQTSPLPRPGHSRQHSTSSTQSTLLLSNVNLPTFPDFIPARNTGSILKEVLKDS